MGEKRVWRMKSKLTPVCIDLMDVNDDGALEVRAPARCNFTHFSRHPPVHFCNTFTGSLSLVRRQS